MLGWRGGGEARRRRGEGEREGKGEIEERKGEEEGLEGNWSS